MKTRPMIIISCEHGGNHVPPEHQCLFRGKQSVLQSHRGLDRGALELAQKLATKLKAPLYSSETTRLLVDLNRSLHHPRLFSEFTRHCDPAIKIKILGYYYYPYRNKLEDAIRKIVAGGSTALHLSIHSFTPRLGRELRRADIGLLYDPRRTEESAWCRYLQHLLINSGLVARRNYPYRGNTDGLTTALRKNYGGGRYLGIEIEINQKFTVHHDAWIKFMHRFITLVDQCLRTQLTP